MKTITAALAALLLAGAATAALAQDRDHERGERGQAAPQAHAQGAPQAGPAGRSSGLWRARPARKPHFDAAPAQATRGFDHREGGQGQQRGTRRRPSRRRPRRDRSASTAGRAPAPAAGRQFDHERGPREVDSAGRCRTAGAYRPLRPPRDGRFDGSRDGHGRRGDVAAHNMPWRSGEHWQAGRAPAVLWSQNRYRIGGYRAPYGYYVRTWGFGDFLPRGWYGQDYWIGDFLDYDLPYPPPGYEWVRVGGDALMIDRFTGRIVQVVRGIFW